MVPSDGDGDRKGETKLESATVLAIGFANPALIYGVTAATIPVVIHLLNRRRFRQVPWAAMRFLMAAVKKNSRRIRIEQLLLLAVRTLVILLMVMAMAKPFLDSLGAVPIIAGRRTHRVLVLDGSLSMGYRSEEGTRFDRAKALAAQLVRDARRGDAISLILMGNPSKVVIGAPSPNQGEVLKELEEMSLSHCGTDLVGTFRKVDEIFAASNNFFQKELVFLTDLQAASWRRSENMGDDGLQRILKKLESYEARSVVIDLGLETKGNRAVTDLSLGAPVITNDTSCLVRAVVHNFGPTSLEAVRVSLIVDGMTITDQSIDLAVGEDHPVLFNQTFHTPGDHLVEIQIDPDFLPLDDRRRISVPVREQVGVLLVDGHFKSEPFQSETDYLALALSPEATSTGSSLIRVEVIPEGELAHQDLWPFDTVVLCNIAQFTDVEVSALDDYLRQGGGLVIFGGDQVVPENYNRLLHMDGRGLLPAKIGPRVGDSSRKQSAFSFNTLGFRHSIVESFANEPESVVAGLTATKTWQFHKLELPQGSRAKVALRFDNGDPAVIEAPRHRGTVVQVATSADSGWTTWPLHASYPPIMEQIILQAAAGRMAERNVRVGQPLDQVLPGSGVSSTVSVDVPGGKVVPSRLQISEGASLLHFEDTELAGPYQVKIGPPLAKELTFAVNPDPAESDPTKFDRISLGAAYPGWKFAYLTNWKELTRNADGVSRRGELHRPLLYAMITCLLLESFLAMKFGHYPTGS
ncbi:MAG: hypothetical protein NVSMB9_00830 [Isosphaeraceae bacterium]